MPQVENTRCYISNCTESVDQKGLGFRVYEGTCIVATGGKSPIGTPYSWETCWYTAASWLISCFFLPSLPNIGSLLRRVLSNNAWTWTNKCKKIQIKRRHIITAPTCPHTSLTHNACMHACVYIYNIYIIYICICLHVCSRDRSIRRQNRDKQRMNCTRRQNGDTCEGREKRQNRGKRQAV